MRWDAASNNLETWNVFSAVLLGKVDVHPTTYNMKDLLEDIDSVESFLQSQSHHQPTFPTALLHHKPLELNKSL